MDTQALMYDSDGCVETLGLGGGGEEGDDARLLAGGGREGEDMCLLALPPPQLSPSQQQQQQQPAQQCSCGSSDAGGELPLTAHTAVAQTSASADDYASADDFASADDYASADDCAGDDEEVWGAAQGARPATLQAAEGRAVAAGCSSEPAAGAGQEEVALGRSVVLLGLADATCHATACYSPASRQGAAKSVTLQQAAEGRAVAADCSPQPATGPATSLAAKGRAVAGCSRLPAGPACSVYLLAEGGSSAAPCCAAEHGPQQRSSCAPPPHVAVQPLSHGRAATPAPQHVHVPPPPHPPPHAHALLHLRRPGQRRRRGDGVERRRRGLLQQRRCSAGRRRWQQHAGLLACSSSGC